MAKLDNGLPEAPRSGACTADLGPRVTLIFSYGDRAPVVAMDAFGSTRLFRAADHALVWDEESKPGEWHRLVWTPNATHWAAIEGAVAQGRAASGPPSRCPPSGATYDIALLASRSGLVAASRCLTAASGAVAEHPLNDEMVGLLAGELQSGQAPALPCPTRLQPLRDDIIVRTADGTLAALVGTCGGVDVGNGIYWQPTTGSSAWLAGSAPAVTART